MKAERGEHDKKHKKHENKHRDGKGRKHHKDKTKGEKKCKKHQGSEPEALGLMQEPVKEETEVGEVCDAEPRGSAEARPKRKRTDAQTELTCPNVSDSRSPPYVSQ